MADVFMLGCVRIIIAEAMLPDLLTLLKSFVLQKRGRDVARARHLKSGLALWRTSQAFLLSDGQMAMGFLAQGVH